MVSGSPALQLSSYDLSTVGYQAREFFVSGKATSYELDGAATSNGRWTAQPTDEAPYTTRVVVVSPIDERAFNGVVFTEWLNVTSGQDSAADWLIGHREMIRSGNVYVGVSAQRVSIEGGESVMGGPSRSLKESDPERYGALSHPGDSFSFDIFSQVGALLKAGASGGILGSMGPRALIALGESQSAAFMTTYVNAVDPVARVYDGFLVHSRFGDAATVDGSSMEHVGTDYPPHVQFRDDLRVPVLALITETDLLSSQPSDYYGARQPLTDNLQVWEVGGTAHADNYLFGGGMVDSGLLTDDDLAQIFLPKNELPLGQTDAPVNTGLPHHYVLHAALDSLERWVTDGRSTGEAPELEVVTAGDDNVPTLATDTTGIALGGVRTPWVDVPLLKLSGIGSGTSFVAEIAGTGAPLDSATIARLYPGGKADFMKKFDQALQSAIDSGHLLEDDRSEIVTIAEIHFDELHGPQ